MFDYKKTWTPSNYQASSSEEHTEELKKHIVEGSALDIGCGSARWRDVFKGDYTGLDISPISIQACKENKVKGKFIVADIVEWDTDKVYDNVLTWTVLQHVPTEVIEGVCEKIKRWGKNIIIVESISDEKPSDYCFNHDYEKLLNLKKVAKIGPVTYIWRNV